MAPSQDFHEQTPFSILDALYCEEEKWEDDDENEEEHSRSFNSGNETPFLLPLLLLEQDLFWEDEELLTLFSKETEQAQEISEKNSMDLNGFSSSRNEAIEWILKVNSFYGFSTLTSVLAVNYFDRFFSIFQFQNDKPWMFQLTAVTCLSLAAKVEETHVPLLLDLQVESGKYMFEAKTIQKMEVLILSTLEWKMNPVTPLSFLDHIIRRLGLKNHLHWEFLRRCERVLLSLLSDWRFVNYLPSVLATATMMHVIDQIEPSNPLDYQNQLLGVLNITKVKVNECYKLIVEKTINTKKSDDKIINHHKRPFDQMMFNFHPLPTTTTTTTTSSSDIIPSSPSGVMDAYYLSCDSSNDSWTVVHSSSSSSSLSSSPMARKKSRVHEQPMPLQLPSLSRVFLEVVGSPR
ncbi:unnamed protein product [Amaranthus hypochondriacus]